MAGASMGNTELRNCGKLTDVLAFKSLYHGTDDRCAGNNKTQCPYQVEELF